MAWKECNRRQVIHWSVFCCGSGWGNDGAEPLPNVQANADTPCLDCGKSRPLERTVSTTYDRVMVCNRCKSENCETRYSCGAYAGVYCDKCWRAAGYIDGPNVVGGATEDEIEAWVTAQDKIVSLSTKEDVK